MITMMNLSRISCFDFGVGVGRIFVIITCNAILGSDFGFDPCFGLGCIISIQILRCNAIPGCGFGFGFGCALGHIIIPIIKILDFLISRHFFFFFIC